MSRPLSTNASLEGTKSLFVIRQHSELASWIVCVLQEKGDLSPEIKCADSGMNPINGIGSLRRSEEANSSVPNYWARYC